MQSQLARLIGASANAISPRALGQSAHWYLFRAQQDTVRSRFLLRAGKKMVRKRVKNDRTAQSLLQERPAMHTSSTPWLVSISASAPDQATCHTGDHCCLLAPCVSLGLFRIYFECPCLIENERRADPRAGNLAALICRPWPLIPDPCDR